jgi:outer membrane biosynthesis protein TonB
MKTRVSLYVIALVLLLSLGLTIGCSKAPNDAQISKDIQTKLGADSGLAGKQINVQAENGTVTLAGTVDNDAQRDAAARYASSEEGVKQVVNNLQVAAPAPVVPPETAQAPPPAPVEQPKPKPHASRPRHTQTAPSDSAPVNTAPAPAVATNTAPPAPAAPAPPPPPQKVTIPSGTTLAVRLVDTIDSETSQPGQTFHATLDSPLAVDGEVAIPSGYDVEGHIVDVKSAGKFAGQSVLALQLDRISAGGKFYNIQTDQYKRQGSSRGKNTAEKVGAGAGIGAIIGAIAGGGKGAAIGAAAGGGLGGGVQAATKGQQIKLPTETVLNFTLQAPITVIPAKGPNEGRHKLDANDPNQ